MQANPYTCMLERWKIAETPLLQVPRDVPEIEIQARWFTGEFGRSFRDEHGRAIELVQPGVWNREPGPDFAEAVIRIDAGPPLKGNIEVDRDLRDWERHGHASNPAYETVVLHVFIRSGGARFFTRTRAGREVPQVRIDPSVGAPELPADLPLARPGRCVAPLRDLDPDRMQSLLDASARHRMRHKSERLRRLAELRGHDDALLQMVAEALGYKENRLPFQLIAQRLPLATLRDAGPTAPALVFGVAGFLSEPDLARFPQPNRAHVRELWEEWWRLRARHERMTVGPAHWKFAGIRPANHPHRRLAALVALARRWRAFRSAIESANPVRVRAVLESLTDPFWDFRYSLRSKPAGRKIALIGPTRVAEILANVVYPFLLPSRPELWEAYTRIPATLGNRRVATAAVRLFGKDGPRRVRTLAMQQALLQIYRDFCLRDASDCTNCRFPEIAREWEACPDSQG